LAVALGAVGATLLALDSTSNQQTTQQTTTVQTGTLSGSVVQYSPGKTIVIRDADGKVTTYSIAPQVQVPAEVQVGKTVTISTQPASDGSGPAVVTRIVTTTVGENGQMKTRTEQTETGAMGTTRTVTDVYGTVTAYQPKRSITIDEPGQGSVTYVIDAQSELPADVAIGKTVTVTTRTVSGSSEPVVRTVIYKTKVKEKTESKPE
jgi:hypothetical protein